MRKRDAGIMIGLFLSEAFLFAAAGLLGFAGGWRLYAAFAAERSAAEREAIEQIRVVLTEAQVRRARSP